MNNQLEFKPGSVVEYLYSNQLSIGSILTTEKHLTLITPTNRTIKIAKSRFLPWIGPNLSLDMPRDEVLNELKKINETRERISSQIDTSELWQLIHEEMEECSISWLAEILWDEPTIDQIAGLGRALIEDKIHFKFLNSNFKVFPSKTVEAKIKQLNKEAEEERLFSKGREFFKALWEKRQNANTILPDLDKQVEQDLKDILKKGISSPDNKSFQKKWKKLTQDIPPLPHLPLILAQTWDMVPRHYNYLLDQADYSWGNEWTIPYKDVLIKLKENVLKSQQKIEDIPFISIDSASTKDIDDAFYVEGSDETGYTLYLAFAYPVIAWDFESELNKEVTKRASSLYLPEGTSHMLPEEFSTDLFSLHAKEPKPVLIMKIEIRSDGIISNYELIHSWTKIDKNLTYKEVEQLLSQGGNKVFESALNIATKLRENRINRGAVIIERQEPVIILTPRGDDYDIELIQTPQYNRAQLIVSEFMILANSIAARWAYENNIPLIFRTQDIQLPVESRGIWKDPVKIYGIIKLLSATTMETIPKPHASIGVEGYAPLTSPLRRYVDFINIAQIDRVIKGKEPWPREKLESMLPYLNIRLQEANKIQKYRTRYWKLLYLKRYSKKKTWQAIVVDKDPQCFTFVLPMEQLLIKAPKNLVKDEVFLGKRFRLKFNKIDPLNNQIKVQKIEEEKWKD